MFNFLAATIAPFDFKSIFSNLKTDANFYIILFYCAVIMFMVCIYVRPKQRLDVTKTKKITLIAMLSAITVVANVYTFGPDKIKFSFVPAVCFISGMLLGPMPGFAVGFCGDLIGAIIAPQGVYNPILNLGSAMWGFVPGMIFWYFNFNKYLKTAISFVVSYVIASLVLNSTAIYMMYLYGSSKTTLFGYLGARIPFTFLFTMINMVICMLLLRPLERIKKGIATVALQT
ncbi:MAG: folate family ECF transporter S component [Christensenellaceae bacterium]